MMHGMEGLRLTAGVGEVVGRLEKYKNSKKVVEVGGLRGRCGCGLGLGLMLKLGIFRIRRDHGSADHTGMGFW